jgi:DNA-binding response OmpR family regulator
MAKGRILLAHANSDCQVIYRTVLTFSGYAVEIVETVDAALQRLAAEHYDVVVSDLYLETVDCADDCLVRQLRLAPFGAHLPTLILTAWTTPAQVHLAHELGADRFLAMPATPRQVLAVIEELLEHGDTPNIPRSPAWDLRHHPVTNGF